jgi:hypothetical protein
VMADRSTVALEELEVGGGGPVDGSLGGAGSRWWRAGRPGSVA